MNKRLLKLLLVFVVLFSFVNVSAEEEKTHIGPYVDGLLWKWYGTDWSTGVLPKAEVDDNLVEGVDYIRTYAFTRELIGDVSKLNYLPIDEAMKQEQLPGSVCEKVEGIGKYTSEHVICHVIYGYSYVTADNLEKEEGESDPIFTFKVSNYNNLDFDLLNFFDISLAREEGEEPGNYIITPEFKLKNENDVANSFVNNVELKSIQFLFNKYGRIIVQPITGKLSIKEKKLQDVISEIDDYEDIPMPPKTDIVFK